VVYAIQDCPACPEGDTTCVCASASCCATVLQGGARWSGQAVSKEPVVTAEEAGKGAVCRWCVEVRWQRQRVQAGVRGAASSSTHGVAKGRVCVVQVCSGVCVQEEKAVCVWCASRRMGGGGRAGEGGVCVCSVCGNV